MKKYYFPTGLYISLYLLDVHLHTIKVPFIDMLVHWMSFDITRHITISSRCEFEMFSVTVGADGDKIADVGLLMSTILKMCVKNLFFKMTLHFFLFFRWSCWTDCMKWRWCQMWVAKTIKKHFFYVSYKVGGYTIGTAIGVRPSVCLYVDTTLSTSFL